MRNYRIESPKETILLCVPELAVESMLRIEIPKKPISAAC
jgi:hypothetical protein